MICLRPVNPTTMRLRPQRCLHFEQVVVRFDNDDDDDVRFVLDQHVELNFNNAISLKQK
jgi:NAD kinase